MRINNNLMAMNTHRQLGIGNANGAKSMEKLSSGYRINRAGDDAAGLAISEKMRGQIRGLNMASRNAQDGISLIQTAEGALSETHAILQRMRELAVQASNDTYEAKDRGEIQKEIDQLTEEIDRIASTTEFNTMKLLNGDRANTRKVDGVRFQGGTQTSAAGSTGLNVELLTTNALADGSHTLEITKTRETRADQTVTPLKSDLGGTAAGKGVEFANNKIETVVGTVSADSTVTLTYDAAKDAFKITGTLTDAVNGNVTFGADEYVKVGEEYNNHGIKFTINDVGTAANGETLTFDVKAAGGDIGTKQTGYTTIANATQATFDASGIVLKDTAELSALAGGTIEIKIEDDNVQIIGKDKDGNAVINDTIAKGTVNYDNHGIKFNITGAASTEGTDIIKIDIAKDTYKIEAQLDGGAKKTLATGYDGTSATGIVTDNISIDGIKLNQTGALAEGTYTFTSEANVSGTDKSLTFQIGSNSKQSMDLDISDMSASALAVDDLSVDNYDNAQAAIDSIEKAIGTVSAERSKLGAVQNRLEHTIKNLDTSSENLQASESRIRDVDMAKEMMEFTKNNILQQAAQAMLAQANQAPQGVLQLLR